MVQPNPCYEQADKAGPIGDAYSEARARLDAALDDYLDALEQLEATPPYEALFLSRRWLRGEMDRRFRERMQRHPALVRIQAARAMSSRRRSLSPDPAPA